VTPGVVLTAAPVFIDFSLLSCDPNNFTFKNNAWCYFKSIDGRHISCLIQNFILDIKYLYGCCIFYVQFCTDRCVLWEKKERKKETTGKFVTAQ